MRCYLFINLKKQNTMKYFQTDQRKEFFNVHDKIIKKYKKH